MITMMVIIINVIKIKKYSKFRLSELSDETVDHITPVWPTAQKTVHKETGWSVARLQFNMYKELGVKLDNKHWQDHVPQLVEQVMKVR